MLRAFPKRIKLNKKRHFSSLPVIDIRPWTVNHNELLSSFKYKKLVCSQVDEACRTVGFFYIVGHGVDPKICASALEVSRRFFELEQSEKEKISILNSKTYRGKTFPSLSSNSSGYQKLGQNITQYQRDWHEVVLGS